MSISLKRIFTVFNFLIYLCFFSFTSAAKNNDFSGPVSQFVKDQNIESVLQIEPAKNSSWIFILAVRTDEIYENLYAINSSEPQKNCLILQNPACAQGIFSNLCYLPENQTLYFSIHNGNVCVNGIQLFYGEGIYVLKKDSDGNYSPDGLRRYSKLEPWLCERAKSAYFDNMSVPVYSGFLHYLFDFCDFDAEPCFVYETDGKKLLNEEALRYLYENSLLDSILAEEREGYRSALEDYLFCLDENKNPTSRPAITANHSPRFYKDGSAFVESHYFKVFYGHVFVLENIGSAKDVLDGYGNVTRKDWSPDFSRVYSVYDSENDFCLYQDSVLSEMRAEVFELPFPKRADTAPLFEWNDELYIRDINHRDFYKLQKDLSFKKISSLPGEKKAFSSPVFVILLCIFAAFFTAWIIVFKKIKSSKFIFNIEQKVRSEISSDIHDSVVQDIRAVRLDVERLKVQPESEELQNSAVKNITACIKKMRDICYSLNPAEIANSELSGTDVDIISVIQTLCEQFSESSKIPFTLDCDKEQVSAYINKNNAQYITRIVQEILSNIQKHSFASKFMLSIRQKQGENQGGKMLTLIFIDDGAGCNLENFSKSGMKTHFGMRNMKQFASAAGAKIEFLSAPDEGMQVRLTIKLEG